MKKYLFSALLLSLVSWSYAAQPAADSLTIQVTFQGKEHLSEAQFYVQPESNVRTDSYQMTAKGNTFTATVPVTQWGFYTLSSVVGGGQVNSTLYVPQGTKVKKLKAAFRDEIYPIITNDKDCRILTTFANQQGMRTRKMWLEKLSETDIRDMFSDPQALAKEADAKGEASETVRQYLEVSAYSQAYLCISNIGQVLRLKPKEVTVHPQDVLVPAKEVLDNDLASLMSYNTHIVCEEAAKQPTLDGRIGHITGNYHNQALVSKSVALMLEDYITSFNYEKNYDKGLIELGEATAKYKLDGKYMEEFRKRVATLSGAEFPKGIALTDKDGNAVDFESFKGKYVYVDLWASWCVPCCKEVLYLQTLEKELTNEDVVFVSISIDSTKEPWLKRMEALKMHGNQLLCTDAKLCESLNVNGIPMFLIYDKQGRLFKYDAPRPSNPTTKTLLEQLH